LKVETETKKAREFSKFKFIINRKISVFKLLKRKAKTEREVFRIKILTSRKSVGFRLK